MKPYYTDPLAAAWMAKYHGMRFDESRVLFRSLAIIGDCADLNLSSGEAERFHVHPDSLHLLEPKDGDLVLFTELERKSDRDGDISPSGHGLFDHTCWTGGVERIIQRDGKPFFWPEAEV